MKILFISLLLPHPYSDHASAFTVFKTIKHLSKKHKISLISFARSREEKEYAKFLKPYCEKINTVVLLQNRIRKFWVRANLFTFTPICVSQGYSRELRDNIHSMITQDNYDIVQMEYTPTGQYVTEVKNIASVINVHDVISVSAKKLVKHLRFSRKKLEWFIESALSRKYESKLYGKFTKVIAISEKIKEHLLNCDPDLKISVIPPGVDIPEVQKTYASGTGQHLIFMGAMWRDENIDAMLYFYHSVFYLIRKVFPNVKLTIVGGSPSEEIQKLANDSNVKVTGYVDDFIPYYLKNDISIAPMRIGGGIQCKILDAMAVGLPVIATSEANAGIGAQKNEEIIIADTPETFAEKTIELLQNRKLRKTIGRRGRNFVRSNFIWEKTIENLEYNYRECLFSYNQSRSNP
ncbi:MAG: glycosyltransferase family 4 protein [Promethearchaeota archaeon]|jgi:glycosyltransferase involved in cell wall biosynthesis